MNLTYRLFLTLSALFGAIALSGCNTAEGVGEDVEAAGEGLQDAAR